MKNIRSFLKQWPLLQPFPQNWGWDHKTYICCYSVKCCHIDLRFWLFDSKCPCKKWLIRIHHKIIVVNNRHKLGWNIEPFKSAIYVTHTWMALNFLSLASFEINWLIGVIILHKLHLFDGFDTIVLNDTLPLASDVLTFNFLRPIQTR